MPPADSSSKVREVFPGLFLLHLPLPIRPTIVNVYLIHSCGEWALVDTGMNSPESAAAIHAALEIAGCRPAQLRKIICTHHHPDHFGASKFCKELGDGELLIHKLEHESATYFGGRERLAFVTEFFRVNGLPMQQWGGSIPSPGEFWSQLYVAAEPTGYIEDGQILRVGDLEIEVIWTPGHTRGHCVLYLRQQRVMIAGDHLLPKITPHVGYYPSGPPNPLADFLDSQRKIQRFEVDFVLPAHGGVFTDHRHRANQIIQHHEYRLQEFLDAVRHRPRNAYEVARHIFGFDGDSHIAVQFPATFETLAHLEYLCIEGKAKRSEVGGLNVYEGI